MGPGRRPTKDMGKRRIDPPSAFGLRPVDPTIRPRSASWCIDARQSWLSGYFDAEQCKTWSFVLLFTSATFRDFQMTRRDIRHMIQAVLLNWLLLILIVLMIASVFSVLLIKGVLLKERQVRVEPSQGLVASCCNIQTS